MAWPQEVERVAVYLRASAAEARVEEFAAATATAADAARAVGCDVCDIVKSLVTLCDGTAVVALVPGDRRGDLDKIARAAGAVRARVASRDEVEALTGFAPGAVAPFPLANARVLIERRLLTRDALWVGAGSTRHMAVLPTPELVRLSRAAPADVVAEA